MGSALKNFIITFFVSLLIFGLIAYMLVNYAVNAIINAAPEITPDPGAEVTDETTADPAEPAETKLDLSAIAGQTFTALIIGTDYQPEIFTDYDLKAVNKNAPGFPKPERTIQADALLLVRVDRTSASFVISALPANMVVKCDGVDTQLRDVLALKDVAYLCDKVTAYTGYAIDYYALFSIADCAAILEKLGGLHFDVPENMSYIDNNGKLKISLRKGPQQLTGDTAVKMLRYASYKDGTAGRLRTTSAFARELIRTLTAPEHFNSAVSIYQGISGMFETNFTPEMLAAEIDLIYMFPQLNVVELAYPGSTVTGVSGEYFQPSVTSAIAMYREYRHVR